MTQLTKKSIIFTLIGTFLSVFLITQPVFADSDERGADRIFHEVGMETPGEWSSWSRETRHEYLQSLGLYPAQGKKYQGKVGDLGLFFEKLGLKEPENWAKMSFEEKKIFINDDSVSLQEEIVASEEGSSLEIFTMLFFFGGLILFIIILFLAIRFPKIFNPIIYYILPLVLLFFVFQSPSRSLFGLLGSISEKLLILLLFVKPIAVLTQRKFLHDIVCFRRQLGVATFWFFAYHAIGLIVILRLTDLANYLSPKLFWGTIAGILMIVLALTSNDYSIKKLKGSWKKLQYLAYPALFATLAHTSLAEHGNLNKFYAISTVFVLLKGLEWGVSQKKGSNSI